MKKLIKCYDSGPEFLDRYTVLYKDCPEYLPNSYGGRAMSDNPFHPQGFGQYIVAQAGNHLGKRIKFKDLPEDCKKLVLQDLK